MKRREERKRARNALIEETIRLEAANNPEVDYSSYLISNRQIVQLILIFIAEITGIIC